MLKTSHEILFDILKQYYTYLVVENQYTYNELKSILHKENYSDIEIIGSDLYNEFTEGCSHSAYRIFEIISQKFPHFEAWELKQLHECSKSFLYEFDHSTSKIDIEYTIMKIDDYSQITFRENNSDYPQYLNYDEEMNSEIDLELNRF